MNKIRHNVLANSLNWPGVNFVLDQWFKQTLCVSYFPMLISGSFGNVSENKVIHYVLAISLGLFRDNSVTNKKLKADTNSYPNQ